MVVVTEAKVKSVLHLPGFLVHAVRSMVQAQSAPGNLGARVFLRGPLRWCTVTAWQDEAAMVRYVRSGAHLAAMKRSKRLVAWSVFARCSGLSFADVDTALARRALDDQAARTTGRPRITG
jgi:hypothetical protein